MSVPQPIDQAEPIAGATAGDDARRLVLTLANHIGDRAVLTEALAAAKAAGKR